MIFESSLDSIIEHLLIFNVYSKFSGTDRGGFGYGGTAKKSNNRQFDNYGEEYGNRNDVVGACIDLDNGELSFTKYGKLLGVAFSLGKNLMNEGKFSNLLANSNLNALFTNLNLFIERYFHADDLC